MWIALVVTILGIFGNGECGVFPPAAGTTGIPPVAVGGDPSFMPVGDAVGLSAAGVGDAGGPPAGVPGFMPVGDAAAPDVMPIGDPGFMPVGDAGAPDSMPVGDAGVPSAGIPGFMPVGDAGTPGAMPVDGAGAPGVPGFMPIGDAGAVGAGPVDMGPGAGQPTTTEAPLSQEQAWLNGNCSMMCDIGLCFVPHADDCRKFIMCDLSTDNRYHGTEQICAHGAFWAGANRALGKQETTCDVPVNVQCPKDPCANPDHEGGTYTHFGSCKQYWLCEKGISVPKCCPGYERYDVLKGVCVYDHSAQCAPDTCPSLPDVCQIPDLDSEPMNDGHCGTYWACESGLPTPRCCPPGLSYNVSSRSCKRDPLNPCREKCGYGVGKEKGQCQLGVKQFLLNDTYCGTYIKCGQPDQSTGKVPSERRCCEGGYKFDSISAKCVKMAEPENCDDSCPRGYKQDCHLREVPGDPKSYMVEANNIKTIMMCPVGAEFSLEKCGCGIRVKGPDNSCNLELNLQFHHPKYTNYGSQDMVNIQQFGTATVGSVLNEQATYHLPGNVRFNIDFFKQSLPEVFLQIDYLPESDGKGQKQILVSNCRQSDAGLHGIAPAAGPSLEVTLENNRIYFRAMTPARKIEISAPYRNLHWNQFKALYNGKVVVITNQDAQSPQPEQAIGLLRGHINVAEEGLEIGDCAVRGDRTGFYGDLAKVAMSKCLTREQKEMMDLLAAEVAAAEQVTEQPMSGAMP